MSSPLHFFPSERQQDSLELGQALHLHRILWLAGGLYCSQQLRGYGIDLWGSACQPHATFKAAEPVQTARAGVGTVFSSHS